MTPSEAVAPCAISHGKSIVVTREVNGTWRLRGFGGANKKQHARGGKKWNGPCGDEGGCIRVAIHQPTDGKRGYCAETCGAQSAQSSDRGYDVLREKVGRKSESHRGPTRVAPRRHTDERERRVGRIHKGGGNSCEDRNAAHNANPLARGDHPHSMANKETACRTSGAIPDVGGYKGQQGKCSDLLQAEAMRVTQVFGQPKNIEPPNGVGQRTSQDNSPHVGLREEIQVSGNADSRRSRGGVTPRFNQFALITAQPRMTLKGTIKVEPDAKP